MHSEQSSVPQASAPTADIVIASAAEAGVSNQELGAFYTQHWARPIALARGNFLSWQFDQAPEANGANHSVVALRANTIIAVLGATPRRLEYNGNAVSAAELTTWIVAAEARGLGIGGRILRFLQSKYDVLTGAGITAAALPLYLKAEFTFLVHMPRFFFVSDFDSITKFASPNSAAVAAVKQRQGMATATVHSAIPCTAEELGDLQSAYAQNVRNGAYLAWRYDAHPVFYYEAFRITTADHETGVVLRQDDVDGTPFLHLVDVTGDTEGFDAALHFVETEAQRRGSAFVDVSATLGALNATLRARGWNSVVDDPLIELPSLFYPIELRRPPTTSVALWARDGKRSLYDFAGLHLAKGDLDLDRPNLEFYEKHGL